MEGVLTQRNQDNFFIIPSPECNMQLLFHQATHLLQTLVYAIANPYKKNKADTNCDRGISS